MVKNLTGQRFGKLVVIERAGVNEKRYATWRVRCDCGNEKVIAGKNLTQGDTTSCGCHKRALLIERLTTQAPEKHSAWKGGRKIDPDGYVHIYVGKHQYVREHVKVMEEHLGRPLYEDESVHHKNGIRHDNRLENLELRCRFHGSGQSIEDLVEWATEVLRRYQRV